MEKDEGGQQSGPQPPQACVHTHNTPAHAHTLTVIVIAYTNPMQAQIRSNPGTERGGGHGVPPLAEALLEMDGLWETGDSVFQECRSWKVDHALAEVNTSENIWSAQIGLDG